MKTFILILFIAMTAGARGFPPIPLPGDTLLFSGDTIVFIDRTTIYDIDDHRRVAEATAKTALDGARYRQATIDSLRFEIWLLQQKLKRNR